MVKVKLLTGRLLEWGCAVFIAWVVCDNVAAFGLPDIGAEFYAQYKWKWLASCS